MLAWSEFEAASPDIAAAATRLLAAEEVAYLATVSASGRPRIHPFVPRVVDGRLVGFIRDTSPKQYDLLHRRQHSIHTSLAPEDEEVHLSGEASRVDDDASLRAEADTAMAFATGPVDRHHILYEFLIDRAAWTRWLDFGTPDHRPSRVVWTATSS